MTRSLVIVIAAVAALTVGAGCGGDDDGVEVSDVSETDVISALNLEKDDFFATSQNYITADGRCRIELILIGQDSVDAYGSRPVATNGDGSVGVMVYPDVPTASEADCVESLSAELEDAF